MPHARASVLAALLFLAVAASGCLAGDTSSFGPSASGGTVTGVNLAGNGLALSFSATPARGEAPLVVTFSLRAGGAPSGVSWSVDFGDGTKPNAGGGLPDSLEHVYRDDGVFTANFTVEEPAGGKSVATLQVVVTPERDAPVTTSEPESSSSVSSTTFVPPPPPPPPPPTTSESTTSESTTPEPTTPEPTTPEPTTPEPTTSGASSTEATTTSSTDTTSTGPETTTSTSEPTTTSSTDAETTSSETTTAPPSTSDSSTDTGTQASSETTTTTDPPA